MTSPFPGMDPYIEANDLWPDFHAKLIGDIERSLAELVPPRYFVEIGERSYIVVAGEEGKQTHSFSPDVRVTSPAPAAPTAEQPNVAVEEATTATGPFDLRPFIHEEFRETFVEIYEAADDRRLVTSLEVLSPSNKRRGTEGWDLYLRKRQALLLGAANLVEIDLLRGGQRMPMLDPWPSSPYLLMVSRVRPWPRCRVWPGHSLQPLPPIPVPLAPPHPDLTLALQPLIDGIYRRSRYAEKIKYGHPARPALVGPEQSWLEQQLRQRSATS